MIATWQEIIQVAESLDWHVTYEARDGGKLYEFNFAQYSPAGEDFFFDVEADDPAELVREVRECWWDFDTDEHVKSVMDMRGAPNLRTLIDDAEDIEEMLRTLYEGLRDYEGDESDVTEQTEV